ncbi:hypothetical protein [Cognatishimia sp. F0-27]|uniref:hypothetical protein n=1 Tax=Cognatishimia sp. F0-27 TaxID=2816855 RepID=UPI001D0C5DE1|nr:hypothetical protein [Cognatishimia sp. F0-27]MCC1492687.1 hypothetical protein [Cognatishimia sp. F0-27]
MTAWTTTFYALIGLVAAPAIAMAQTALDGDGDGMVTLEELQAVHPDVTSDAFMQADTDGDAMLSAEELAAAQDAGVIPGA